MKLLNKFWIESFIFFLVWFFGSNTVYAKDQVKRLRLNSESVSEIRISTKGTILSFPGKPQKVILGKKNSFGLEYIENDVAVSPLYLTAQSNLTIYLEGRRYTFKLVTSEKNGEEIVIIRDSLERSLTIKVK